MKNIHAWESSGSGLKKSECVDIFHQSFLRCCAILTSPNWAKQLSMATIPFCFEFFRCHVDVLQHYFSRSTISIAVFCLQNLICLLLEWCWVCLVPRRLSFDENVRAKEGGNETPDVCTLPMVPCGSPVTSHSFRARHAKNEAPEEEADVEYHQNESEREYSLLPYLETLMTDTIFNKWLPRDHHADVLGQEFCISRIKIHR